MALHMEIDQGPRSSRMSSDFTHGNRPGAARSSRMHSGFTHENRPVARSSGVSSGFYTHYAERYVERFSVTQCSEKLVTIIMRTT